MSKAILNSTEELQEQRLEPVRETRERILDTAITEFAENGFSGARIEAIARGAKSNIRMIYHYFGNKEGLYIRVLEHVLEKLREDELRLNVDDIDPVEGLLSVFDFIDEHFASHPKTLNLLSSENLNRARYMKQSTLIPEISSPVIKQLEKLLTKGLEANKVRAGIDPLHLYVCMVSLAYFHKSNAFTLSRIFQQNLLDPAWQATHKEQSHQMLRSFLLAPK